MFKTEVHEELPWRTPLTQGSCVKSPSVMGDRVAVTHQGPLPLVFPRHSSSPALRLRGCVQSQQRYVQMGGGLMTLLAPL